MWQNHFFASLAWLLPPKYRIDPEYPVTSNNNRTGSVDFRIVGPDFCGSVEWLISEYGRNSSKAPKTVEEYILEHYYRFVKDPNGVYKQKYMGISNEPFLVINVSHQPSKIEILDKIPFTFLELIVDDQLKNVELHVDGIIIPIKMGEPFIYDFGLKEKIKPRITIPEGTSQNNPVQYIKCILNGITKGVIGITNETTLKEARDMITSELDDIPSSFKFAINDVHFSSKQEQTHKCVNVGVSLHLSI